MFTRFNGNLILSFKPFPLSIGPRSYGVMVCVYQITGGPVIWHLYQGTLDVRVRLDFLYLKKLRV